MGSDGKPIAIGDLWTITTGKGGNSNTLYFTSGVQNEADGLFGSLTVAHTG